MGTLRNVAGSEHQAREVAMFIPPHATLIVTNERQVNSRDVSLTSD
jgi:hypothetical protein